MKLPPVVFVESPEAARRLADSEARQVQGSAVVALSPWAEYELERLGIAFTRPEDYTSVADVEQLGAELTNTVLAWCHYIDDFLRARFGPLRESELRPAFSCFFWLKILHDAPAIRLFLLERIAAALKPSAVMYFPMAARSEDATLRFMDGSVYDRVIPLWARHAGIGERVMPTIDWNLHPVSPSRTSFFSRAGRALGWSTRFLRVGLLATKRRLRGCERQNILALNPDLAEAVIAHSPFRVVWWRSEASVAHTLSGLPVPQPVQLSDDRKVVSFRKAAVGLWRELSEDDRFRDNFRLGPIDFFPVVESRLRQLVEEIAPRRFRDYLTALQQFRRWSTQLVLASNLADPVAASIAQAARAAAIPVVAHDHGSMGYFHFPLDRYVDSAPADYRLVWGIGVAKTVAQRYPEGARPIAVGAQMLDALLTKSAAKKRADRRKWRRKLQLDDLLPVVLYAPTSMSGNNRYISHLHMSDSDLFLRSRRIVSVFRDFPEVQLVVKLHPGQEYRTSPIVDLVADHGVRNCRCVRRGALSDMLDVADMFVTDSPTTTLLQMLTTGKRVLIWHCETMVFEDGALELLKESAIFAKAWDEFEEILRDHLANKRFQPLDGDRGEFLRTYGTHNGDGRSGERVVQAVRDILGVSGFAAHGARSHTAN